MIVGAVGFVRAHDGANLNAMIPLYTWMAVLAGLALHRIGEWLKSTEVGLSLDQQRLALSVLWIGFAAQMLGHIYQPGAVVPQVRSALSKGDVERGARDAREMCGW